MGCELYYGSGCEYYQSRLLPQGGSSFVCTKQQNKSKLPVGTLAELWSSFICFYFPLFQKNEVLLIFNRFIYLLIYGPVFFFFLCNCQGHNCQTQMMANYQELHFCCCCCSFVCLFFVNIS